MPPQLGPASSSPDQQAARLYFAYGSNTSVAQMARRCPGARYVCLGRLAHYGFYISERGFANVRPRRGSYVYGAVYMLPERDEAALDRLEGVPWAYGKWFMRVEMLRVESETGEGRAGADELRQAEVLVYVEEESMEEGVAQVEYQERLMRGAWDMFDSGLSWEVVRRQLSGWVVMLRCRVCWERGTEAVERVQVGGGVARGGNEMEICWGCTA